MSNSENDKGKMGESTKILLAALVGAGIGAAATWLLTSEKGGKLLQGLEGSIRSISEELDQLVASDTSGKKTDKEKSEK